ncbi:MAG: LTA synthase family protein, partial [Lachnospiraceae bacterium]|nr:LTA synthase family protein [Lachnospiraceae bacterium]
TKAGTHVYMNDLEMLQYDLLYGKRYAYNGQDLYPATDLEMGIADVVINRAYAFNGNLHIYGENFTKWSSVYVNGSKVDTTYHSGQCLSISLDDIENGDTITVCQLGSSNTIFRQSNSCKIYLKELDEDGNVKMENTGDVFIPSTSIQDAETEEH